MGEGTGREGQGGRVANRAYMMNIGRFGHGDSNSSAATSSARGRLQVQDDKVVFCVSALKLMHAGFFEEFKCKTIQTTWKHLQLRNLM